MIDICICVAGAVELRIHFIGQSDDELCIYRVVVDQKMFAHLKTYLASFK